VTGEGIELGMVDLIVGDGKSLGEVSGQPDIFEIAKRDDVELGRIKIGRASCRERV